MPNLALFVIGFAFAVITVFSGCWTKKGREKETREFWPVFDYMFAFIVNLIIVWMAVSTQNTEFTELLTMNTWFIVLGYVLAYPLIHVKRVMIRKQL